MDKRNTENTENSKGHRGRFMVAKANAEWWIENLSAKNLFLCGPWCAPRQTLESLSSEFGTEWYFFHCFAGNPRN